MLRTLSPIIFPNRPPFRRKVLLPEEFQAPDFEEKYDYNTLAYDAISDHKKRTITLICPKLYNFEKFANAGGFQTDQEKLRIQYFKRWHRFDEICFQYNLAPSSLKFMYENFENNIQLSRIDQDYFNGMNCLVTKSKNNSLNWIRDWIRFHIEHHALEGLVLFDNNSDRYSIRDLHDCVSSVCGIKRFIIVPAPFRFGTFYRKKYVHRAKFLQVALLNIARLRFLAKANAVLSIDIDELVAPLNGSNVFEKTKKSFLGYTLFSGHWRHAPVTSNLEARHADHIYRTINDRCQATKYCIDPQGVLSFRPWDVHGVFRGSLKKFIISKDIHYYHCRQITTQWKYVRDPVAIDKMVIDENLERIMSNTFRTGTPSVTS